uniref:Uncharacterized protein n=1 Tax=Stegastes partitus TaxID=144197 RepID=A0A3B5BE93_9TELE
MFTDEVVDSVSVQSLWRKSRQAAQESRGCQTRAVHSAEGAVQTVSTASISTQTEQQDQETEQLLLLLQNRDEPDPPGLRDFLQRVEGLVIRELVKNAKSHAFDGLLVNSEDYSQRVSRTDEPN